MLNSFSIGEENRALTACMVCAQTLFMVHKPLAFNVLVNMLFSLICIWFCVCDLILAAAYKHSPTINGCFCFFHS